MIRSAGAASLAAAPFGAKLTDRQIERHLAKGKVVKSEEIPALGRRTPAGTCFEISDRRSTERGSTAPRLRSSRDQRSVR